MRIPSLLIAFLFGCSIAACTDPEEEDLGSFPCGDQECDVRSEICAVDERCDGSEPNPPMCAPAPDECDGTASAACLDASTCSQGEEGGFSCGPVCG